MANRSCVDDNTAADAIWGAGAWRRALSLLGLAEKLEPHFWECGTEDTTRESPAQGTSLSTLLTT